MCSCRDLALVAALRWLAALAVSMLVAAQAAGAERFPGIGRSATPAEVAAWDIDVRPDFKGLPPGRGNVARGQALWEAQCAGCHGVFGESNEVFMPLVGGTTAADIAGGRVARLAEASFPQRTMLMKLPTLATLWDYIHRAMPWTAPKSLAPDDVYALTAYLLNLADVVPADFELNERNIRDVQQRLPNRNGIDARAHAMWPGAGARRPDVQGSSCMRGCAAEPQVASMLPDFARSAHGDLAQQQRLVGPQRGASTAAPPAVAAAPDTSIASLLNGNACSRLPPDGGARGRTGIARGRQQVRRPQRRCRLPRRKDPRRRIGRVGQRADAGAADRRSRRGPHRTMARGWCQTLSRRTKFVVHTRSMIWRYG